MILVSKRPEVFPMAEDIHRQCGAYQLQAALRAFGKDAPLEDLYPSDFYRKRDWSLPWNMPRILDRFGIRASVDFWRASRLERKLAEAIERDQPTLFVINSFRSNGCLHWISAWGHDEGAEALDFLSYDSQLPTAYGTHGNARYGTPQLAEVLPWRGTFAVSIAEGR